MFELIYERAKGILVNPVEHYRQAAADSVSFAITYYLVLLAVFAALFTLAFSSSGLGRYVVYTTQFMVIIITMLVQMIVSLFIGAVWLHIWTYVAGGRKDIRTTLKVVAYAMTPMLLLGWFMPVGAIVGSVWYIVLQVLGVRELQQLTTGRAILAVSLSIGAMVVLIMAVLLILSPDFLAAVSGSTTGGSYRSSYPY